MAKQAGMGDRVYVAQFNISTGVQSLPRIGGGPAPLEMTDITQDAMARLGGQREGEISLVAFLDKAAGNVHDAMKGLPTTDRIVTYGRGQVLGNPAASMMAKQINYDGERASDGMLTFGVQALSNGFGLEWCKQLTAGVRTDTTATNGVGVDYGAGFAFGLQAYLHVFAFTGTSVTIKLQQSSDNGGGDAFADVTGGGFTVVTGATSERIQTAVQAVERYLRVVTTGTFSNVQFVVTAAVNEVSTVF